MFIATLLKPRPRATTSSSSPARQSRMFQRRAARHRRTSVPATRLVVADSMEPVDDDIFTVAPAFDSIDVVAVVPDLPPLPEVIQPPDIGPAIAVYSARPIPVESVDAAPGMAPTMADVPATEVAVTLVPAEEIAATLPAMDASVEPEVQLTQIITAAPAFVVAGIVPTDAPPTTPKKLKRPHKKRKNEGLSGGTGKTRKPRRSSPKAKIRSGTPQQGEGQNRLPIYGLDDGSYAHSPP